MSSYSLPCFHSGVDVCELPTQAAGRKRQTGCLLQELFQAQLLFATAACVWGTHKGVLSRSSSFPVVIGLVCFYFWAILFALRRRRLWWWFDPVVRRRDILVSRLFVRTVFRPSASTDGRTPTRMGGQNRYGVLVLTVTLDCAGSRQQ